MYYNANWSEYAQSGISVYALDDSDGKTITKNFIENNIAFSNQELVGNVNDSGLITDGNGLIIDDNLNTQGEGFPPYAGRTLVANNLSFLNGGSGLHSFESQHVDFVANTAYMNNQTSANAYGQMFVYAGNDVTLYNNILWPSPYTARQNGNKPAMSLDGGATSVIEDYNLIYPYAGTSALGGMPAGIHNVTANPEFTNASSGQFTITSTSAARGNAIGNSLEPSKDIVGAARPSSTKAYDIGAYQYDDD